MKSTFIGVINRLQPCHKLNYIQSRTAFTNKYMHGPLEICNPKPDYIKAIKDFFGPEGKQFIIDEIKRMAKVPLNRVFQKPVSLYQTNVFENFDSDESLKRWKTWVDRDALCGFSTASLSRSRDGHMLFKGVLDNQVPDDGTTMNSGFVCMMGQTAPKTKMIQRETYWDWSPYNQLEIKCRGDGRKYIVVLNVGTYLDDMRYYDMYAYPIYTRGGPYWQTFRIPFSKFIFSPYGKIQDVQRGLTPNEVKFVAITLADKVDGPFSLELDHIGLRKDPSNFEEVTPYENYSYPHIKLRPVAVDGSGPH